MYACTDAYILVFELVIKMAQCSPSFYVRRHMHVLDLCTLAF